jgi:two-component system, chemotaxis family, protein-glutamate methylesterase/glutaminase
MSWHALGGKRGQTLRFRCRVGDAFTADAMLEDQRLDVERALWAAMRVLEENPELSTRLTTRARKGGHAFARKRYEGRAEESKRNARIIRELLNIPQVPRPARPLEEAEEEASAD